MTRLFNLESCVECYQYARLFNVLPEQLIPERGDLPRKYKDFIQHNANVAYLPEPALAHNRSQELEINPSTLDLFQGTQLNEGDDRLFIIRDTVDLMTLATGGFLSNREKRLYASAYHYWNHISEFSTLNFTRPLVIIDLDSFGCDRLQPISFEHQGNSPYPVPILDTRRNNLTIDFGAATTYKNICQLIACQLLSDKFPSLAIESAINHLAQYLQRISFFEYIQSNLKQHQESFNLSIELLHQREIFYKEVNVQVALIQKIILKEINTQELNHLASQYPEFQFSLLSQYPVLEQLQSQMPEFIISKSSPQDFKSIWQQQRKYDFPLFGFYLDNIEFAINIDAQEQWIQLSSQSEQNLISYEGEKRSFIGFIPSTCQDYFVINKGRTNAVLPIRVNGEDYCVNGVVQDYHIEIGQFNACEDIQVGIEFNLQPDSPPEIIVRNFNDRSRLKCELRARQTSTYRYIPSRQIATTRFIESNNQINRLQVNLSSFRAVLSQITQQLQCGVVNYNELVSLFRAAYRIIDSRNSNVDPLQFINTLSDNEFVNSLLQIIQSTGASVISEQIPRWLTEYGNLNKVFKLNQSRRSLGSILNYAILFLGKTYQFSQALSVGNIFPTDLMIKLNNLGQLRNNYPLASEYLKMLARIAVTDELQRNYFGLFNASYNNVLSYQSADYLWGYWRILRWYFDCRYSNNWFDYRGQFKLIIQYLIEKNSSQLTKDYKVNAFSSLIYLLTFCESDLEFCRSGSEEMRMAAEVIEHFRNDRTIQLNQISRDRLLNEYFEQLITGKSTESDMRELLRAG